MFKLHTFCNPGIQPQAYMWCLSEQHGPLWFLTVTKSLVSVDSIYYVLFSNVQTNCTALANFNPSTLD